jgi:hypothetical protein
VLIFALEKRDLQRNEFGREYIASIILSKSPVEAESASPERQWRV